MKNKQLLFLLIGLIVLCGLGWLVVRLVKGSGNSDEKIAALNFEIKDTASVDRIIIAEPNGMRMELIRKGNGWTDKDGGCVDQSLINNVLEGAFNLRFKGYLPQSLESKVLRDLATSAIEVEYFKDGDLLKKWYIGANTSDHYGTYMLLETPEGGKSDLPVIAEIKGLQGIIAPRYVADPRKWACTGVFALEINEIAEVDMRETEHPERSFNVKRSGRHFSVTSNGVPYPALDTNMVLRYLNNYQKIHYNVKNYELAPKQVDSLLKSKPFTILTVKETNGTVTKLRMFHAKPGNLSDFDVDAYGDPVKWDQNIMWIQLPSGEVVKGQFFVFGPLIDGRLYWQMPEKKVG